MPLSVILVDDEPTARRRLKRLLLAAGGVTIVAECATGAEAVAAVRTHPADAIFLDVQMPEMSGFDVLRVVGPGRLPLVVFVTAFDEFALQAFEAHAIDYLLKPFDGARVQRALARVRTFLAGRPERDGQRRQLRELLQATAHPDLPACLLVKRDDRVLLLRPADVDWIEATGDYARVHTGNESHLMRATLAELQQKLAREGFVRVHRSRLVNLARIREFRPSSRGESTIILRSGARLEASYTFLREIQDRLGT
jgi:two-component system LytT family response regulator